MIVVLIINILIGFLGIILSWLPDVTTLPTMFGYNIDSALVNGVGQVNLITQVFWPLHYVFLGFGTILGYYVVKITFKLFLGSRAPH